MKTIRPDWPAPNNIIAFSTTREGGCSEGSYKGLNIAHHVGDACDAVKKNRSVLAGELPGVCSIQWLTQEHGAEMVQAGVAPNTPSADGCWSDATGVACAVMTADCLPVLLCSREGDVVGAAHAGWRGLKQGILEACVAAMPVASSQLLAWLGPAIGPKAFEVGAEVRQQFLSASPLSCRDQVAECFSEKAGRSGHFLADLYGLARIRLNTAGVSDIYGGEYCTFSDPDLFYSYRRDGQTGRMAAVIVRKPV